MDFFHPRLWSVALLLDMICALGFVWTNGMFSGILAMGIYLVLNVFIMALAIVVSGQKINRWFLLGLFTINLIVMEVILTIIQFFITLVSVIFGYASPWALIPILIIGGISAFILSCQKP